MLARVRRDHNCTNSSACSSTITRFVWDGDQILYEIQAQGGNVSATALENDDTYGNHYGRVLYTHGPGIDAPLDIIRMRHAPPAGYGFDAWGGPYPVVPFGDWRGTFVGGTTAQGVKLPCDATYCLVAWPGKRYRAFLERDRTVHQQNFFGSLTTGQENSNGLMYMRNRYYNPLTGAFTQTDPIGLAGGLNTYGYAEGNPASYSDPYGLKACPEDMTAEECEEEERRQQEESQQREERAQRIQQCYENNRFSSVVGSFTGSETAQDITRVVEIGSATSLGTDAIAMIRKGRGALGTTNRYASGFNMISRSVLRAAGRRDLIPAATRVGNRVTPILAVTGALTVSDNTTTYLQCRLGVIE